MVSPLHTSSLNPYSLPFFIPLRFACRRRPNPIHLFVPFSIAMFSGLGFNSVLLFEALWLFSKQIYKNVFFLKLLFLQIRCQVSAVCFVNHCIGRPDGSALSGLPKPFTLVLICADFFICKLRQKDCCDMQQSLLYQSI